MTVSGSAYVSVNGEGRASACPYCGSLMGEGRCPRCGYICQRCGTPTKELPCPHCGHGSIEGYSPTGSPAPAQSPELADVQRILGRMPSRREFNMVRGMVDRDKERIHRLAELLCQRHQAPLSEELIELRALQVRNKAAKSGSELTHAECVTFAFLEAAKHSGTLQIAMKALAEAQLLDSNLRLGLSKMKLASMRFMVEVSGIVDADLVLLIDGEPRPCKTVELEALAHSRTYLMHWSPLLADCLSQDFGSEVRRVSAAIRGDSGLVPLRIAWKEKPSEMREWIDVTLDPRRFFYGFTTRKEVEVDIGIPGSHAVDSDAVLALRKLGRQLDSLETTTALFRMAGGSTPSSMIWANAKAIVSELGVSRSAVTPRKKAAAALIAADMHYFAELGRNTKTTVAFALRKFPLTGRDAAYTCIRGLIVPSEFSRISAVEWADAFSLAVKF